MERINILPRNQILKELQTYKKYRNDTQKEISTQFAAISDLRSELHKLEKKKVKLEEKEDKGKETGEKDGKEKGEEKKEKKVKNKKVDKDTKSKKIKTIVEEKSEEKVDKDEPIMKKTKKVKEDTKITKPKKTKKVEEEKEKEKKTEIEIHLLLLQSRENYPSWDSPYIIAAPTKKDLLTKSIKYMDVEEDEWNGMFDSKKAYKSFLKDEFEKLQVDGVESPELDKAYLIMYKITTM